MKISYKVTFIKQYNRLDKGLQEEVLEKIELLKDKNNHTLLKVHKLHGRLKENYSFYVNYKIRIVFVWEDSKEIILLAIGDHDIYK
ncbi:MAG: type II toxin-antitoxin system mRNA interferase toxin, RelE/StbE family [Thermoplasmata archaeon]|nr:type II toxin-antitoxin system mRNA interferase toxin, RelE/StbE family [Thermoplasmata archaeon]